MIRASCSPFATSRRSRASVDPAEHRNLAMELRYRAVMDSLAAWLPAESHPDVRERNR